MFSDAEAQLEAAKILPGHDYYKHGAVIIRELLREESISERTYYRLAGVNVGKKLLEKNVFAFHVNSRQISFQSTVMKRYCEEHMAVWKRKSFY
jgi:hypothetical protein